MKFPLWQLPSSNWYWADRVLFLDGRVLDERNMPGKTLGVRRLQCGRRDLHPLGRALVDIPSLLQSKVKSFIDCTGRPFIYEKTYSSKLTCYKIKRIDKKDSASLLWVHGVNHPFTIPRPPVDNPGWARILHLGPSPWLLYDYAHEVVKPTYRRV